MPPSPPLARIDLLDALRNPAVLPSLEAAQWSDLLRQSRRTGLLPRFAWHVLQAAGAHQWYLPSEVEVRLQAALTVGLHFERSVRWEVDRIAAALGGIEAKVVLLKGAAYVMADLPNHHGRLVSDIDILVSKPMLPAVEQALLEHGWESLKQHEYDDYYYRAWMHELPPLYHPGRKAVVDVHHTILPPTGRLHPDPEQLIAAARPLEGSPFYVLSPEDMVLHSAAHLFHEEDLSGGLRDLVDLDALLRQFALTEEDFWHRLLIRASRLGLRRPLFYAIDFLQRIMETPVPKDFAKHVSAWQPWWPAPQLMRSLGSISMLPMQWERHPWLRYIASWTLYVRAHWLKMPPLLLLKHLLHKSTRRWLAPKEEQA